MSVSVMFLGGGKIMNSPKFIEIVVELSRRPWCQSITAWEKEIDVVGLVFVGWSERWKRNFTCTLPVAHGVFEGDQENPADFIEDMVLESDAETPQETVGKRTFTAEEVRKIVDGILADIPPDQKKEIENILKPQFKAWIKMKFPDWVGQILDMSIYSTDPTKIEIRTTVGVYDVIDLDRDVPSIVAPLKMTE